VKQFKSLTLGLVLSGALVTSQVHALGKNTTNTGSSSQVSSSMQNFLLSLGLFYAKTNPQVGPVLTALGINTPADLNNFLKGDKNGSNIQDIITNAAIQYAFSNPQYAGLFDQLGVTDFASLKALLTSGGGGANQQLLLNLAFNYMQGNSNYQSWLSQLGVNDASDLQGLLSGTGDQTDLMAVVLNFAMIYAQANPQYAPYIMLINILLGNQSSGIVDIANPFLGSFEGLSNAEIRKVQSAKKLKL